jgi:ABC-type Zn uptake system ZnuABC Zn-binding protein ZnuA
MRVAARGVRSVVALAAVLLVGGCGVAPDGTEVDAGPADREDQAADAPDPGDGQPGTEEAEEAVVEPVLQVVATVAPITDLVARVGGERVAVSSLVPPGADSHTYEPRPQDVALLADADAYLGVGLDLNDGAIELAEQHLPDGAPVLRLGELALDEPQLVFDHSHDDGHSHGDDGHSHGDDGHSHGGDGHSHGGDGHSHADDELGPNPHVWTSVRNAAVLVAAIAEELAALDPDGADEYLANADALIVELEALDDAIAAAAETVPDEHRILVTYHDAWTYFARDHGFEFVTAVQPGDYSEPSAAEVRRTIDLVRELEVPAIFGSEVFPNRVVDAIAAETGATYVGDLADDVLPGEPGDPEHSYVELMRRNATTIVDALGGDSSALTS